MNKTDNRRYEVLDTSPTFKYKIGEWVWFMKDNKPASARVWIRALTEEYKPQFLLHNFESMSETKIERSYFLSMTTTDPEPVFHYLENQLFATKQELLDSL